MALENVPVGALVLWDPVLNKPWSSSDPVPVTGGSGGGGGGAVTVADGADATQGTTTDAAWSGTGSATINALLKAIALVAESTNPTVVSFSGQSVGITGALPAGAALLGKVGIDQTTPGTTNLVAIPASELHLGEVGGNIAKAAVAFGPASSTTYTTGQVLLGTTAVAAMARVANGTGYIFGATLALNALNTVQVDLFIFSAQPTGTYTAGATFTLTTGDQAKLSKVIHLDDWTASGAASSFGQPLDKGPRLYRCDDGTTTQSLWVVAVARGSITLVAATDGNLTLRAARN